MTFLNTLIASDTARHKVFAFVKRDALNAPPKIIQLLTAYAGKNPKTSNAYCVKVTTQPTIKVIWSMKIYKRDFFPHYEEK
jgi:hypothetical protein